LPGKVLVVLMPETGLATDVFLTPDGHAQERSLLDEVLARVQERDLWIADRNFCTLKFLFEIAKKLGFFVIRQHGTVKGKLCGRRVFRGEGPTGKIYEQTIELVYEGKIYKLRRITVELLQATRDGDTSLHLLSNLPAKVSAIQVADLYRRRWTIETLFLEVTTTLTCEIDTLCYPKAALFVFCLALVAANAVALVKAALRAAHGEEDADELSGYYLALEVKQVHEGMMIAVPASCWDEIARLKTRAFANLLKKIAAHVDLEQYRKNPRGPKKPRRKRVATATVGTYRPTSYLQVTIPDTLEALPRRGRRGRSRRYGKPSCAPVSTRAEQTRTFCDPSRVACRWGLFTGGFAPLNHRLIPLTPFGVGDLTPSGRKSDPFGSEI
jgi:hypothetical protein